MSLNKSQERVLKVLKEIAVDGVIKLSKLKLAEKCNTTNVTSILDALEEKGFIVIERSNRIKRDCNAIRII